MISKLTMEVREVSGFSKRNKCGLLHFDLMLSRFVNSFQFSDCQLACHIVQFFKTEKKTLRTAADVSNNCRGMIYHIALLKILFSVTIQV